MRTRLLLIIFVSFMVTTCKNSVDSGHAPGSFGYDLHFLSARDSVIVLRSGSGAAVIVSPRYQGKVLTSTASGDTGRSFGWVHYKAFDGPLDPHMNAYGGENRFWLGPEGGKFSLFFPPGAKMEFANWKTPAPFDTESWDVLSSTESSVELRKDMQLVNYAGTRLSLSVDRRIAVLDGGYGYAVYVVVGYVPAVAVDDDYHSLCGGRWLEACYYGLFWGNWCG